MKVKLVKDVPLSNKSIEYVIYYMEFMYRIYVFPINLVCLTYLILACSSCVQSYLFAARRRLDQESRLGNLRTTYNETIAVINSRTKPTELVVLVMNLRT